MGKGEGPRVVCVHVEHKHDGCVNMHVAFPTVRSPRCLSRLVMVERPGSHLCRFSPVVGAAPFFQSHFLHLRLASATRVTCPTLDTPLLVLLSGIATVYLFTCVTTCPIHPPSVIVFLRHISGVLTTCALPHEEGVPEERA